MPLTTIDAKPALVVIDVQKGLASAPTVHGFHQVATQAGTLAEAFRRHELPVVLVNVTGGAPGRTDATPPAHTPPADWADLADELNAHDTDHYVTKQRWGAFHDTSLQDHLQGLGVTQVFLAGIATSIGVESTARTAAEFGYHVVLVTDAMTDLDPDAHVNSIERIFPRLGESTTVTDVVTRIEARGSAGR